MSATLIAVAALTLIATVISFVVIMRPDADSAPPRDSTSETYVDPDVAALKSLSVPSAFRRVHHKLPNCRELKMSRCYITALPEAQAANAATQMLSLGQPQLVNSELFPDAHRHRWCGKVKGQPMFASLSPNVDNAKRVASNIWKYPGGPEFDDRWVLWVSLPGISVCD